VFLPSDKVLAAMGSGIGTCSCQQSNFQGFKLFSQFNIALWISNLESKVIFFGFKTQTFHFHFLTQTDIPFSSFLIFRPERSHLLVYFNRLKEEKGSRIQIVISGPAIHIQHISL
jgi:hypothetical protein